MRIGIFTQPLNLNYGGILQAWALQAVLLRKGYSPVTFDAGSHLRMPWWRKPFVYGKRQVGAWLRGRSTFFHEEVWNRSFDLASVQMRPFIEKRIRRREYRHVRELREEEFDMLLAGSDQVWRPRYNCVPPHTIEHCFFDFAKDWDVKRVAYAASFGTDEWEYTPKQTRKCAALAQKFEAIGVREKSGVRMCREHFGVKAVHVPDPTLLLERTDYEELIDGDNTHVPEGDLLCYILDKTPTAARLENMLEKRRGLIPFRIPMWTGSPWRNDQDISQPSVEQWLRDFRDAKAVVTDSFHACVFSILFRKPFVVLGNPVRGMSRYRSLLGEFGLERCLVATAEEGLKAFDQMAEAPWERLAGNLAATRRKGNAFLDAIRDGSVSP